MHANRSQLLSNQKLKQLLQTFLQEIYYQIKMRNS